MKYLGNLIIKLMDFIGENLIVCIFLFLAFLFGIIMRQEVGGLALLAFAMGIAVGQSTPK